MNDATSNNEGNENAFYTANLGRKWTSTSPTPSHKRAVNILAGAKVQVQNETEAFELFLFLQACN